MCDSINRFLIFYNNYWVFINQFDKLIISGFYTELFI